MGKDWYWGARKSSKKTTPQTDIPSGCMCAFFKTFDFHPFHFSINQPQHHSPINSISKEPEAPRNSLESQDEQSFKIPKNIRTRGASFNDLSTEKSFNDVSSPGTRTPTLVARLMGLDLLPDANSPSSSSSSSLSTPNRQSHYHTRPKPDNLKIMKHRHSTDSVIMRSLPETPRLSSERTSSFVEHRLSLQINNKENMNHAEDLETPPRFSFSKLRKHVKESVGGRKVGKDITNNTIKNTNEQEKEKEDLVTQIKFMKPLKPLKPLEESNQAKHSNTSHSPRLSRFNDSNNNHKHSPTLKDQNTHQVLKQSSPPPLVNIEAQFSRVSTKTKSQAMSEKEMMMKDKKSFPKCKKTAHGNLSPRINKNQQTTIRNKQQESFIIRPSSSTSKVKKTHPLSNNTVSNFLPLKTHPSPSDTKIPQKQVNHDVQESKNMSQLFSSSRQKYTICNKRTNNESNSNSSIAAIGAAEGEEPEYQYITTILNRTGIHKATITNLQHFQWFSSSHPLDPSIFHRLELYPNNKDNKFTQKNHLGPRCNRRLLFDLLDEVLSEILMKPNNNHELLLLDTVWKRVRSFPLARCEVLEDIDGLIEMKNLMDKNKEEEEGEKLVAEIEGKVLEMLVNETITVMVGPNRG